MRPIECLASNGFVLIRSVVVWARDCPSCLVYSHKAASYFLCIMRLYELYSDESGNGRERRETCRSDLFLNQANNNKTAGKQVSSVLLGSHSDRKSVV